MRKRTSSGKKLLRKNWRDKEEFDCEGSAVRVDIVRDDIGVDDICLYAAALPYALAGVAAAGCMLHRASVLAVGGLILCRVQ